MYVIVLVYHIHFGIVLGFRSQSVLVRIIRRFEEFLLFFENVLVEAFLLFLVFGLIFDGLVWFLDVVFTLERAGIGDGARFAGIVTALTAEFLLLLFSALLVSLKIEQDKLGQMV